MLKPALARGELHVVGATTLDEYRKHIEKDAALERRFQPGFVGEPAGAGTIASLRGLKERYEAHHRGRIRGAAPVAGGGRSHRDTSGRFLPHQGIAPATCSVSPRSGTASCRPSSRSCPSARPRRASRW